MTEYATREAAEKALVKAIDATADNMMYYVPVRVIENGWTYTTDCKEYQITYPVIPPDLTTVWVRNDDHHIWKLDHSKGTLHADGCLQCYRGYRWEIWTTDEPKGWRE